MAFDLYKTKTMLSAVEQMEPVHSFLRDRYFPPVLATCSPLTRS